jgi:hypothetical protein
MKKIVYKIIELTIFYSIIFWLISIWIQAMQNGDML